MTFQRHIITSRVISDLKKRSTLGIFFYLLVPFCIFFTDGYFGRHQKISLIFLSIFTSICLFRFIHLYISRRAAPRFAAINTKIFIGSVILTALTWGAGAAFFLVQAGESKAKLIMTICTAGFGSGGVVSFMPERRLAIIYNLLMILPAVLALFWKGQGFSLGVALLFYSAYLFLITLRGNDEYWTALENEYLLERKTEELKLESRIDALTGLFNRRHFDELYHLAFGLCARRKTPITLMICDIDCFKKINDTFGHLAGDAYLKYLANRLKEVFQRETDVVARYGGEEFVVLLPDEALETARQLAETFRNVVAGATLVFEGQHIQTTISIGIASWVPMPGQHPDSLLGRADSALYIAKNGGRNRVLVDGEAY